MRDPRWLRAHHSLMPAPEKPCGRRSLSVDARELSLNYLLDPLIAVLPSALIAAVLSFFGAFSPLVFALLFSGLNPMSPPFVACAFSANAPPALVARLRRPPLVGKSTRTVG